MSAPRVSFIVPAYNAERTLNDCALGILRQTGDFEALLIDDGSTDGTRAMLDCLAATDPRVRVIHRANGGVSAARNDGLDAARGDYVCFADSDDLVSPYLIASLADALRDAPDIVFFSWIAFAGGQQPFADAPRGDAPVRTLTQEEITLLRVNTMYRADYVETARLGFAYARGIWGCLMRRAVIEENALRFAENVKMGEDAAFKLSFLRFANTAVAVDRALYGYRQSEGSVTHKMNAGIAAELQKTLSCLKNTVQTYYPADAEMARRFCAEVMFESQWLFLLYLSHRDCALPLAAREGAFAAFLAVPLVREAVKNCDEKLLLPPLDKLLIAYRTENVSAAYAAAAAALKKSGLRQKLTDFLSKIGLLGRVKHLYRAARQKTRK